MSRPSLVTLLPSLLLALAACPPSLTEQEMFDRLGVDTTPTPRTYVDRGGVIRTLDAGYNPLGPRVRTFQPLAEVYLAGRGLDGGSQLLLDDAKNSALGTTLPLIDPAETWTQNQLLAAVPADLDGDGVEEVVDLYFVVASAELRVHVLHRVAPADGGNGGGFVKGPDAVLPVRSTDPLPAGRDWFQHSFAAADVDGDGKQELVVVNFGGIDVCAPTREAEGFTFACTPRGPDNASRLMSVARGRFDDDPLRFNDSVVVAWGDGALAHVDVYDGTPDAFSDNAFAARGGVQLVVRHLDRTAVSPYSQALVASGDLDLDGRDEILLSALYAGSTAHDLVLMDDARANYRFFSGFRADLGTSGVPFTYQAGPLLVFTKRSTPTLEKAIYASSYLFDGLSSLLPSDTTALPTGTTMLNGLSQTYMGYMTSLLGVPLYSLAPRDVVAGDLDGSGADTLVALWDPGNARPSRSLSRKRWDPNTGAWTAFAPFLATTSGLVPCLLYSPWDCPYAVALAMPNVDRDSPTVRYRGEHEVTFSTPRVLALLSAPPYLAGVNEANSQSSISFGTGSGLESESSIGFTAGFSVGYEAPDLFGLSKASFKVKFDSAMDWISRDRVEMTQTETWTTGTEDAVVFSVIPFDVYYYEVLSSPTPAEVGSTLTLNVPRKLTTYKVPVALYNESIVGGPKITAAMVGHTPGVPASYPRASVCPPVTTGGRYGTTSFLVDAASWCFASTEALHTGVGSGSVGFEIARTSTSASGTSNDFNVGIETEAGAGGWSVGLSVGFHYGYSYTVDTTTSYSFAGQVGDLPALGRGYDFGLMVHKATIPGQGGYPVFKVDYWVANLD